MNVEKTKFRKYKREPVDKTKLNEKQRIAFEYIEKHYYKYHNPENINIQKQSANDQLRFQI